MLRPVVPTSVDDVFIPNGERLEEERQLLEHVVRKNAYPGDWRIRVGVVFLVISTFYLFYVDILEPWMAFPSSQLYPLPDFCASPVTLFAFLMSVMALICYAMACFLSAGSPPPNFKPLEVQDELDPFFDPLTVNRRLRWCDPCENWKPPRTHHCKVCGICVLRGDHHCMWTANCIGIRNHKPFLLFLYYLGVLIWLGMAISLLRIANILIFVGYDGINDAIFVFCLFVACCVFQTLVGRMFQDQITLVFGNVTTIEKRDLSAWKNSWKKETEDTKISKKLVWPYQRDNATLNSADVFHDGWLLCWLPTIPESSSEIGTSFPLHPLYVAELKKMGEGGKGASSVHQYETSLDLSDCAGVELDAMKTK